MPGGGDLIYRELIDLEAHPVCAVIQAVRRQGLVPGLDKHNWPWSMMLLPGVDMDVYELTNNHVWRMKFRYGDGYPEYLSGYLDLELTSRGYTEEAWIYWGFSNYCALLNCGFDLMPSGGTAVRCVTWTEDRRLRFAHAAPFHIWVDRRPIRPRWVEVKYLIERVANELRRHGGVLSAEVIGEYRDALEFYQAKLVETR